MSPWSKHPARGFCREPGAFHRCSSPGLHPAEALQAPYDRGAGALKMRLEFPHIAARVIHLQQGAVVRLRPRLARIGRRRALSPAGCVLQHAVQRADDLRPVADAVGRQTLPRQRIDAVRQFGRQRPRDPQRWVYVGRAPPLLQSRTSCCYAPLSAQASADLRLYIPGMHLSGCHIFLFCSFVVHVAVILAHFVGPAWKTLCFQSAFCKYIAPFRRMCYFFSRRPRCYCATCAQINSAAGNNILEGVVI